MKVIMKTPEEPAAPRVSEDEAPATAGAGSEAAGEKP